MKTRKAALTFLPCRFALATTTLVQRSAQLASESERFPFLLNTNFTFWQQPEPEISTASTTIPPLEPQAKGESDVCFDRCLPNCCQKCATLEEVTYSGFNMTAKVSFAKCKWSGAISWASAITESGSFEGRIENFDPREYKFFTVPAAKFLHLQIHDGTFLVNGDNRMCQSSRGGYDQVDYWAGNCSGECGGQSAACDANISVPNPTNAVPKMSRLVQRTTTTTTTTTVEEAYCALFSYPDESGLNSEGSDESGLNSEDGPAASFLSLGPLAFLRSVKFDGQPLHPGIGDMWLVRSSSVHIQGRYSMEDDVALLSAIAIGGPVLDSKILLVEPENGTVRLNGYRLAVGVSESEHSSGIVRVRNGDREYEETRPYAQVEIQLPGNIRLLINRYNQFLNFKVTMPKSDMSGVEGQCCVSKGTTENESNLGLQAGELNVLPRDSLFRFLTRKHNEKRVGN